MNIAKLKDDPFLNAISKSVKLDWKIEREWNSEYIDLDTYSVYDSARQLTFNEISYDRLIKVLK